MIGNLDVVDVYTNLKKRKHSEKRKKKTTQRTLNIKMSTKGVPVFTFSLPGVRIAPLPPCQLRRCVCVSALFASGFSKPCTTLGKRFGTNFPRLLQTVWSDKK